MAEITQKDGTWSFEGDALRLVPGEGRGVHQLRTDMGEVSVPLEAISGVSYEPGRKRSRLRLRLREGADPFTQSSGDIPDNAHPYNLLVDNDRAGTAEYLADAVRNALVVEQIPVDTPTDSYLLPGPSVPRVLHGSDGKLLFDGEQFRIEWGSMAETSKKETGTRTIPLHEVRALEWARPTWESGFVRLVPHGTSYVPVKPSHDPNTVVLWGVRESRQLSQGALLAAAVTARLPHPHAPADAVPPPTAILEKPGPAPRPSPAEDHDALLRRLRELGELRAAGILTEEEFTHTKQALLRRF